jgi:hypothetical protein
MMRFLMAAGLFLGAHFCLCYIIPQPGPGMLLFPVGSDELHGGIDRTLFGPIGGLAIVLLIGVAGLAVLAFCAAFCANFGWLVPVDWWRCSVVAGACLSAALYLLHLSPRALLPLAIDAVLLYVVLARVWTPMQPAR